LAKGHGQEDCVGESGEEEVNGRPTVKYLNKNSTGARAAAVWVDLDLKFVVKWETATSGAELREIKEEKLLLEMFSATGKPGTLAPPDERLAITAV
jgi:hypothetical protein